jgi:tRNA (guanine-N7-)-methyltransferase
LTDGGVVSFEILSPGKYLPRDYWTSRVDGVRAVEVEIGTGDGRFLAESARAQPNTLFVGFEVKSGLVREATRASRGLRNVLVHRGDGRWITCHLLASCSIDAFHVYFPDPWWKKRHHKRRLFTPEFCEALLRCLKPGGSVYLITDVEPQFTVVAQQLTATGFEQHPWYREETDPAQSSYERKYRRQGRRLQSARFAVPGAL